MDTERVLEKIRSKEVIPVGVLTYRRPELLNLTLESFVRLNIDGMENFTFVFIVQGTDNETLEVIEKYKQYTTVAYLYQNNKGCGWGYLKVVEKCLDLGTEFMMILEDDWLSLETLFHYLKWIRFFFAINEDVGQIRLRSFREHSGSWHRNRFTKEKIIYKQFMSKREFFEKVPEEVREELTSGYPYTFMKGDINSVVKSNAHFTTNPTIVLSKVLANMQPIVTEFDMAEKFHNMGLASCQLNGNCFRHFGGQRTNRVKGWKK